jgi:hypothetical protein
LGTLWYACQMTTDRSRACAFSDETSLSRL